MIGKCRFGHLFDAEAVIAEFFIVDGAECFGVFLDHPGEVGAHQKR